MAPGKIIAIIHGLSVHDLRKGAMEEVLVEILSLLCT